MRHRHQQDQRLGELSAVVQVECSRGLRANVEVLLEARDEALVLQQLAKHRDPLASVRLERERLDAVMERMRAIVRVEQLARERKLVAVRRLPGLLAVLVLHWSLGTSIQRASSSYVN